MARVCVFDVNETLLDLAALDPIFQRLFGDASLRKAWFAQMLQSALVATITNAYSDFGATGIAALEMIAARQGVALTEEDRQQIRDSMQHLPPHPEVKSSLEKLRAAGLRLASLTNSTQRVAEAQLSNAGLTTYFERILSADSVKRLKPAPEPYRMAAQHLGVGINDIRLIAAHSWDVAGALRAGCAAAFVARPGMVLDPLVARPDVVGGNLEEVTELILAHEAAY
jgi:2-haloacid dehalogenase